MKRYKHITTIVLLAFVMGACGKDQQKEDRRLIEDYLADHGLVAESTASGLYYIIHEPGNHERPTLQDEVTISYKGYLLNGNVFDQGNAVKFPLAVLIDGWQDGIPLFGKGGKGVLLIPSHLGYGGQAFPGIPAHSVLVFDIHLIDF